MGGGSVCLCEERGVEDETKGEESVEEVQFVYSELSRAHWASGMVCIALVPWDVAVVKVMWFPISTLDLDREGFWRLLEEIIQRNS